MSKVTQKGQVTIPKAVREVLGIIPGDEVSFQVTQDRQVIVTRAESGAPFAKYAGYLSSKIGQDTDHIVDQLRGDAP